MFRYRFIITFGTGAVLKTKSMKFKKWSHAQEYGTLLFANTQAKSVEIQHRGWVTGLTLNK